MNDVRAKLSFKDGFRTTITAGKHTIIADEPESAGGMDEGPAPYDLLLSALGACTVMTLKMYIDRKKLPVTDIEVMLSFDRIHIDDCESCTREETEGKTEIQHISRLIYVTGEINEEQRERLLHIAGRCPVHITLHSNPHVEDAVIVRK
ncbi:MAG: OsmC family protein [Acidobacteria bacterium]|jgi:putative redox protein|nr:OsmC family protein [Acidobacteriota bacterium]MBK7601077.1 OsmC family protein [Acidobacteriota bacterium]MBK8315174.1 OsmC family protein [Acidobacteriota bacterium]MBK9707046.1 OsmC family protein [Acidobacteriota bacterium]